jgi:hypothetical protein
MTDDDDSIHCANCGAYIAAPISLNRWFCGACLQWTIGKPESEAGKKKVVYDGTNF